MAGRSKAWWAANYRLLLVAILLLAALLRVYGLNNLSPPGLEHDEVAHWLINRDILAGNHTLYTTAAYGHETGFHYLQTLFMVLLGENAFVLRLPSALAGILLVAVSFTLARRLFGLPTALLSAALLAFLFWPIFYSRLALRAISLPLLSGLSAYFWWRGWPVRTDKHKPLATGEVEAAAVNPVHSGWIALSSRWFALAGLFAGLSFYTYMASRVVPIFYLLFAGYLLLFHRTTLKKKWQGVLLFFLVYLIVVAPLALYLLSNPGAEFRVQEVDAPLQALMAGNFRPALDNVIKILGMFGFRGDPLWRQNVAHLPVFDPLVALFFYIGCAISLWRWQEERHLFLILWLFTAFIPSIVTIDAPSSIRIVNALPILTIFPAIGLQVIQFFKPLSTVFAKLSPKTGQIVAIVAILVLLLITISRSTVALFQVWPKNEEVHFVWQKALTDVAGYLDAQPTNGPVAIGGWTPDSMDPPTMDLTLQRDDLEIRYFDPSQSVIIPAGSSAGHARIAYPAILPIKPEIMARLEEGGFKPNDFDSFEIITIADEASVQPQFSIDTSFGDEITLMGYDVLVPAEASSSAGQSESLRLVTYWRVEAPPDAARRIFLHAVDSEGNIVAQDDALGAPAEYWRPGDILLQYHQLDLPSGRSLDLQIGLYDPASGRRLFTERGVDFVPIDIEQ